MADVLCNREERESPSKRPPGALPGGSIRRSRRAVGTRNRDKEPDDLSRRSLPPPPPPTKIAMHRSAMGARVCFVLTGRTICSGDMLAICFCAKAIISGVIIEGSMAAHAACRCDGRLVNKPHARTVWLTSPLPSAQWYHVTGYEVIVY